MKTGDRIRQIRKERRLTLEEVEQRAGLSAGNLSRIERGEQWISEDKLFALSEALSVAPAAFFDEAAPLPETNLRLVPPRLNQDNDPAADDLIELLVLFKQASPDDRRFILNSARSTSQAVVRWTRGGGFDKG
jgi:transcriptional regulator with XRE-family HTH domain